MDKIGKCSLCGGEVVGDDGAWFGKPPPPSYCLGCGATSKRTPDNVIPMYRNNSNGKLNPNRESQQAYFSINKEKK